MIPSRYIRFQAHAQTYIIVSQARITPFTCEGRTRLNDSQEIPPNASGVTNSVASTSPKRSTTVSQMIDERIQCFAAPSGNGDRRVARAVRGAGASATSPPSAIAARRYELRAQTAREMTRLSPSRHVVVMRDMVSPVGADA